MQCSSSAAASYDGYELSVEIVFVAGIEEKLSGTSRLHEHPCCADVALADEGRIGVHTVHFYRHAVGPGGAELRDWDAATSHP